VADSRVGNEFGLGHAVHGLAKQVEPGERVGFTREKKYRAANARPVLNSKLFGVAWSVQWVAEQNQPPVGSLQGCQARHSTSVGVATPDRAGWDLFQERRDRFFGFHDGAAVPG